MIWETGEKGEERGSFSSRGNGKVVGWDGVWDIGEGGSAIARVGLAEVGGFAGVGSFWITPWGKGGWCECGEGVKNGGVKVEEGRGWLCRALIDVGWCVQG